MKVIKSTCIKYPGQVFQTNSVLMFFILLNSVFLHTVLSMTSLAFYIPSVLKTFCIILIELVVNVLQYIAVIIAHRLLGVACTYRHIHRDLFSVSCLLTHPTVTLQCVGLFKLVTHTLLGTLVI